MMFFCQELETVKPYFTFNHGELCNQNVAMLPTKNLFTILDVDALIG
jgi:hypothetical protein